MARSSNWQLPVGAVALVLVGIVLLLQNLGYLPWSLWPALLRFWPLLLIAVGVRLVLGPRLVGSVIIVLLLVGAFAGAAAIAFARGPFEEPLHETLREVRGTSDRLEAKIGLGAGSLEMRALPEGSGDLVQGEFPNGVRSTLRHRGDTAVLQVNYGPSWLPWRGGFGGNGRLALSRDVPIELEVVAGAADLLLDLTDLQVTRLSLDTGASDVEVRLPASVTSGQVEVNAGAADITLIVPRDVAARIQADSPLSDLEIDEARFPRRGDIFESPDFATAERHLSIEIDVAAASITVR